MGAAAYNRGSRAISAQLDRELPDHTRLLFRDLAEVAAAHADAIPFMAGVVRFGPRAGEVSIMDRPDRGWGEYAYTYPTLWALVRRWRVAFVGMGRDDCSRFLAFVPLPRGAA